MSSIAAIFLHGGGDHTASRADTFGRFAQALAPAVSNPLLIVVAEAEEQPRQETSDYYLALFQDLGLSADVLAPLVVTPDEPLTATKLAQLNPCGVFVCGGSTPFYHQSLSADLGWVDYLREHQLPYAGSSAGAAIASQFAILGGWQAERDGQNRATLFVGASEGLDPLTVRPGLGLVPFAIDVHASQWGTLLRLIQSVELGLVARGWAIDEDTMLEVSEHGIRVHGRGHAYAVERSSNGVLVSIHTAGANIA